MMKVITANLAVVTLNMIGSIGLAICTMMHWYPLPVWPLTTFITGSILVNAVVWLATFFLAGLSLPNGEL